MEQEPLQSAEDWAVEIFGAAELGDPRRTDRLIRVASSLAANPSASLERNDGGVSFAERSRFQL